MTILRDPRGARGTAAQLTASNPVLGAFHYGLETDTGRRKRGDGLTAWNALPYVDLSPGVATDQEVAAALGALPTSWEAAGDTVVFGSSALGTVTGSLTLSRNVLTDTSRFSELEAGGDWSDDISLDDVDWLSESATPNLHLCVVQPGLYVARLQVEPGPTATNTVRSHRFNLIGPINGMGMFHPRSVSGGNNGCIDQQWCPFIIENDLRVDFSWFDVNMAAINATDVSWASVYLTRLAAF